MKKIKSKLFGRKRGKNGNTRGKQRKRGPLYGGPSLKNFL
jgi:hypothetical protein